jgi:lipoprotein-releasing system permease protein
MSWYLYLAFKQLFPSGKPVHFFTVVSTCGVMLGVMILIIVQSVMNGFGEEIRSKIVDTSGHVQVESASPGNIFHNVEEVMEVVRSHPGVQRASPYAHGVVMVQQDQRPAFPFIRSVELDPAAEVIPIEDFLVVGELDLLDDDSVFLSSGLAMSLGARRGSVVEVYSPLMLERLKRDEILLPRALEVAGIFETGWHQVDENTMVGTRRLMQDLYGLGDGVHGIALRLERGFDADRVARELNALLPPRLRALSWLDTNRDFLFILQLEKNVLFFLLLFIILVAAFAITSSLLITVVRKTKEIGLLGALGAQPRHIAACFCFQGFLLGVAGTVLGVVAALVVLHFRNNIVYAFARLTQSEEALVRYYHFAEIPVHYAATDFVVIIACSILISTMAGLIPAIRASRMKPTEAFRNE